MQQRLTKYVALLTPPLSALVLICAVWEALVHSGLISAYLLPAPSAIVKCLMLDRRELSSACWTTVKSLSIGFLASAIVGLIVALALSSSRLLYRAFYPFAVFFQTVPVVAVAPLLVIWFGYGAPSVIASAFIVSIFPMIAATLAGLNSTDQPLKDLFRLYGATRFQTLWKLRLPMAVPQILSGLKIVGGLAVIGTIVGEFIGGVGLGSVIDTARTQQRVDKVFAAVSLTSLLGLFTVALIDLLSREMLKIWQPSQHTEER